MIGCNCILIVVTRQSGLYSLEVSGYSFFFIMFEGVRRNEFDLFSFCRFSDLSLDSITESKLSPTLSQYQDLQAYNNSKLCNVLFSLHLNKLLSDKGVQCNSLHPGNIMYTNLSRHWWLYRVLFLLARPFTKSLVIECYSVYFVNN